MKVLINFSTLKSGGGQNVAMNFLHSIFEQNFDEIDFYYFVAENSAPHKFFEDNGYKNFTTVPRNPIKRILFELFLSKKILEKNNIDIIYSYFGIGLFSKKIPQVSGSADSNLYFPEIDFWSHYKGFSRLKKKLVDLYRIWGLKRATAVVFENSIMEKRAKEIYNLKNTKLIYPSINFTVKSVEMSLSLENNYPSGLFLCGWQLNKNIMKIPELASLLKKRGYEFNFLLTAPLDNSDIHKEFESLVSKYDVKNMVNVIGPVRKEQLEDLYNKIDYVFLLSKLESFSNNIIESWFFKRTLIVADELWAKAICKDAAVYVNRDSSEDIVCNIINLIENDALNKMIHEKAIKILNEYPSIDERIIEEVRYIRYVYENC